MSALDRRDALYLGLSTGALVFVRMLFAAGDSFSYDYANYMTYFRAIGETDVQTMLDVVKLSFPYVLVPGGGAFEFGFVALAKLMLRVVDPSMTYAIFAAVAVGLRTFVMRRLGLGWGWILAIQLYAITLFEANALRAGLAVSLTLLGLLAFLHRRQAVGTLVFVLAASQHLQVVIFCVPFLMLGVLPASWRREPWMLAVIVPLAMFATVALTNLGGGIDVSKLDDYAGQESGAVGLNIVSLLSLVFVAVALLMAAMQSEPVQTGLQRAAGFALWVRSLLASLPALALLLFATELSAVGDRAWQFSLVILVSLSAHMVQSLWSRLARAVVLGSLLAAALVNILLRYPLSNFFAPPLPYEHIVPLWLVL